MKQFKPSVKTAIVSALVLTSTVACTYAIGNAVNSKSQDNENKLKLAVEKIDRDTVKVSIDNIKDIPKSLQFSIKLEGNISLKDGEDSIHDLIKDESNKKVKNTLNQEASNILTDYTYNKKDNTIDVLITSDNSLPKNGNKVDVFTLDIESNSISKSSATTYKVVAANEDDYKYISNTNKEYGNLGVVYDDKEITMNEAPTITVNKSYVEVKEGEALKLTAENLGITLNDEDEEDKNNLKLQVKDKSDNNKVITEFKKSKPGVYELECVAIDSYGEKSESVIVYVHVALSDIKEPPTITRNNEKLKDITISGGDIFKPLENVKAVDANGREVDVELSTDNDLDLDPDVDTVYTLTYTATDIYGNKAEEVIKLTVIANKPPVINGVQDHVIKVGDTFNPEDGVSVVDEDDDIELKINSNVNTAVPGTYKVLYTATDSKGKTTRAQSIVTVNPKSVTINSIPEITASDKTIKVGDRFTDEDALVGVTAYDKEDKDITNNVKVVENKVDTTKEGQYTVTYSVEDSKGAKAIKTITVTVKRKVVLVDKVTVNNKFDKLFVGGYKVLTSSINNNADIKDVKWSTSNDKIASVESDGHNAKIIAKSAGSVTISVKAVDGSDKEDSVTIEVVDFEDDKSLPDSIKDVIDTNVVMPITGTGKSENPVEFNVRPVETNEFNKFINKLKDFKPVIELKYEEDNFTVYKIELEQKKRFFSFKSNDLYINIKVDNNLENAQELKNILNNISNQAPEIFVDGVKTTIFVGEEFNKLDGVSAIDFEDGNITENIVVIGDVDTSTPGEYELTYEVTDKNGNKSSITIIITVIEKKVDESDKPVEPGNPENPGQPEGPNLPSEPENPEEPEEPNQPSEPENPEQPEEPSQPSEPGNPEEPEGPNQPSEPEKPEQPGDTDQPDDTKPEQPNVTNNAPVISISSTINKLYVGDKFNALDGVKANDKEDGDLTQYITVTGEVDTSKAGKYTIVYSVKDSDSNETTLKRVIEVVEKSSQDFEAPKTGDAGILGLVGTLGLAVGGLALVLRKKND